jgi:hypothetical protein
MRRQLPVRFWVEAITGSVGAILFVVTLISREWFELLTGIDPDRGSGALEITFAVGLLVVASASITAARRDFRGSTAKA